MSAAQLTLTLPTEARTGSDDFLTTAANQIAVKFIAQWPNWPSYGLVLTGPDGAGKSHLAGIWQCRSHAIILTPVALNGDLAAVAASGNHFLIDAFQSDWPETALMHFLNRLREASGSILIVANRPPRDWNIGLADLASRLKALPVVEIAAPDDASCAALMVKLMHDRQLRLEPDVLAYLQPRLERSYQTIAAVVVRLDALSLATKRPITIALARAALAESLDQRGRG